MANAWRLNTTNPRLSIWREELRSADSSMKRAIQKELLQNITEILKGKFNEDDTILVTADRHGLCLITVKRLCEDLRRHRSGTMGAGL